MQPGEPEQGNGAAGSDARAEGDRYGAQIRRIARGAGVSSFGMAVSRILNFLLQVALARLYGSAQLGAYVLGVTVSQLANVLSQIGMDNGVVRYVARYRAENDVARMRGIVVQALAVTFGLSVLISAAIFFGANLLAARVFGEPSLAAVFRIFAVAVPFFTLMSMSLWATQGFQTVRYTTLIQEVAQPFCGLVLAAAFYLLGAEALGAAFAYLCSMIVGSLLAVYYLLRVFPALLDRRAPIQFESRALFGVSGPMTVASFSNRINTWSVVTILGMFASQSSVGIFNAALGVAGTSMVVLLAFSGIFSPMISSLHSKGLREELHRLYKDVSRWSFTAAWAVFLGSVLLAKDLMALFGPEFVSGWPVIVSVCAVRLFATSVGPTTRMLAMTGHQKVVMVGTLGATVLSVLTSFALVPYYGILGATVSTSGSILFANAVALVGVRRRLGISPYNFEFFKPLVAGLAATLIVLVLKLTLPIPGGLIAVLVLGSAFVLLFVGGLLALGLSPSDKRFLGTFGAALRRSGKRAA